MIYILVKHQLWRPINLQVFVPGYGIPEDPVTGSAQCVLRPWWAPRLGVDNFPCPG